jgi:hypothetical protein
METQRAYPPETGELSLQEAIQADLSRLRGYNMRFAERLDAMAETEQRPERLAQLNNASVKTARAVRQIAVLQLEIAGERPLPNVRTAPAAASAANVNKTEAAEPEPYRNGPRPCPRPWDKGDYTDYDDYTDNDRRICLKVMTDAAIEKLRAAQNEDFRAAGREAACKESFNTKLELIHGIPHPAFDECLKGIHPDVALLLFKPSSLYTALLPQSPDALAEYDAKEAKWAAYRQRRDSS